MDRLREVARALKKTYGSLSSGAATEIQTRISRIPSGSLNLDHSLGGGVAIGRVLALYGDQSGGKSTTALRILGIFQDYCRRCIRPVADVEAVPPSAEVLAEDPQARWSAKGTCTCMAEGLVEVPVPDREKDEKAKEYKERLEAWRATMAVSSYQEMICIWVDPEDAFDTTWAEKVNADPRRIFFARPTTGEEGVDMVTALMHSGQADLIVVDSLAHFVPRKEVEESAEDWQQGLQARIVNKGIRKWISGALATKRQGNEPTQIWINQTRIKIGVMFGDPNVKPAGRGQDFAASTEIKFLKSKPETISDQYGSKKETTTYTVSELIRWKVTKNKTAGTKGMDGWYVQSMRAENAGTILEEEYVFKMAMHHLVEKTKNGYKLGDDEWTSQKAILVKLRDDQEFFDAVKSTLLRIMMNGGAIE